MKFAAVIHKDESTDYGVTIPDFPGCFSSGVTIDDALKNTAEAIGAWIEVAVEQGEEVPFRATDIEDLRKNPDYSGSDVVWILVDVDLPNLVDWRAIRINVGIPALILDRIDKHVEKIGQSRGVFLMYAAIDKLDRLGLIINKEEKHEE